MKSSLDEALALLMKWKSDANRIVFIVCDGPPDEPESFFFGVTGYIKRLSESWVEVCSGINRCHLRLNLPGTIFQYVETQDRRLAMDDEDRQEAGEMFEGCLSISRADGTFGVLNVLRQKGNPDGD
jgi:hypothetical protein